MKTFTVHARPGATPSEEQATTVLVKEGFAWLALFFPMLWLLFNRMWLVLLAWFAVGVALAMIGSLWPASEGTTTLVAILFAVWFAFEANGFRRWSLGRRGYAIVDVVSGRDRWEAELVHFRRAEAGVAAPRQAASAATVAGAGVSRRGAPGIGLFPEAGR